MKMKMIKWQTRNHVNVTRSQFKLGIRHHILDHSFIQFLLSEALKFLF